MIPIASLYFTNFMAFAWGENSLIEFTLIPITILPFMIYTQEEKIQKFIFLGLLIINWFSIKWIYVSCTSDLFQDENIIFIQSIIIFLSFSWTILMLLSLAKGNQDQSE